MEIDLTAHALHLQNLAFGQVGDDARDQLDDFVVPALLNSANGVIG
jgi:hypothetical protein